LNCIVLKKKKKKILNNNNLNLKYIKCIYAISKIF